MRPMSLPMCVLLASLALPISSARGEEGAKREVVERADSKNINVTAPASGSAIVRDARLVVIGNLKVAPAENPPQVVVATITREDKLVLGSWGLVLGAEDKEHGYYQVKEGVYTFSFKAKAPNIVGRCALTVESIQTPSVKSADAKIVKERSKPIPLDIR